MNHRNMDLGVASYRSSSHNDLLDVLIVGGGPAGTSAAFRARELGLEALVIDFDDMLKRIRDYPKDKLILPDFGGGDRMAFPAGGECVSALQFGPIDKDEICARWKGLYETFDIPVQTGLELSRVERDGNVWRVHTIDRKKGEKRTFRTVHLVLAIGRGVPRRLDIAGNMDGIAYRMDDPASYIEGPVLVVGGGTSAAEAVMAISSAKSAAQEPCSVYWAFRGTKMPMVSKALADEFFEAFIGNGNIRSLPNGEPHAVVTGPEREELLSVRVDRKTLEGRPPETMHLEFRKDRCIACIGEDIPEKLLLSLGIAMVATGDGKKMAVTPLLETQQPNIYLIGDLLSQSYLETTDFNAPADAFKQVKHRGNIKSSLRDGVFVAEVIKQRLEGRSNIDVVMRDAVSAVKPPPSTVASVLGIGGELAESDVESPADAPLGGGAALVLLTPAGIEADEFRLKAEGTTTLGRVDRDIPFPQDTYLSDQHASISYRDGTYYLRDDGSRSGTYLRLRPDRPMFVRDGDLLRAGRQILVVVRSLRGEMPHVEHYDPSGQQVGDYPLDATTVFGRSGGRSNPDVILDDGDTMLSRFHLAVVFENDMLHAQDFSSRNGTFLKIHAERPLEHGDVIRIGSQQLVVRLREDIPEKEGSGPVVVPTREADHEPLTPPPAPPAPQPPVLPRPSVTPGAPTGPYVTFAGQNKSGALDPTETLLHWADENEVSIDYECWSGNCGCDVIRIVSGAEHLNEVNEKEMKTLKRKGLQPGACRLACMCKASGPVVVEVVT